MQPTSQGASGATVTTVQATVTAAHFVTPAQAGVQGVAGHKILDSGLRRNDDEWCAEMTGRRAGMTTKAGITKFISAAIHRAGHSSNHA